MENNKPNESSPKISKSICSRFYHLIRPEKVKDQIFDLRDFETNIDKLDEKIKEYIEKRDTKKIVFFNDLKDREKKRYEFFQKSIIIIAATITVVNVILYNEFYADYLRAITAILGALVVIFTSIISFKKYQTKMLSFKIALRTLEKELYLFLLNSGEYSNLKDNNNNSKFILNIENILEKEALDYIAIMSPDNRDPDKGG